MASGDLALVLHAHLPYVRSGEPGSLEEDWYFQALQECYLPLVEVLENAAADPTAQPRLTLGLSPTLLALLSDTELNRRFLPWLDQRRELLAEADPTSLLPPPISRASFRPQPTSSAPAGATCCPVSGPFSRPACSI